MTLFYPQYWNYCGWKKFCITLEGWNTNNGINNIPELCGISQSFTVPLIIFVVSFSYWYYRKQSLMILYHPLVNSHTYRKTHHHLLIGKLTNFRLGRVHHVAGWPGAALAFLRRLVLPWAAGPGPRCMKWMARGLCGSRWFPFRKFVTACYWKWP